MVSQGCNAADSTTWRRLGLEHDTVQRGALATLRHLPKLGRNQERAVRRVCGVLDGQILPVWRVMPDRDAVASTVHQSFGGPCSQAGVWTTS